MTIEEIRKGAPYGADGYSINSEGIWYWMGESYVWIDGKWRHHPSPPKNIKPL